jgi:hypothetical protein
MQLIAKDGLVLSHEVSMIALKEISYDFSIGGERI